MIRATIGLLLERSTTSLTGSSISTSILARSTLISTAWLFHSLIYGKAEIRFLKGRVRFEGVNTKGERVTTKCGMHDSMIVVYRPRAE